MLLHKPELLVEPPSILANPKLPMPWKEGKLKALQSRIDRLSVTMLHELLLALVGCTGDVFVDTQSEAHKLGRPNSSVLDEATQAEPANCPIMLALDIDFVSDSERWEHLLN